MPRATAWGVQRHQRDGALGPVAPARRARAIARGIAGISARRRYVRARKPPRLPVAVRAGMPSATYQSRVGSLMAFAMFRRRQRPSSTARRPSPVIRLGSEFSDDRALVFSVSFNSVARRHRRDKLAERHGRLDADGADARAALVQQVGQLRRGGRGRAGHIRARHADARVREEGCADRRRQPDVRAVPQLHEGVLQREVPARAAEATRAVHRGRARGR